MHCEAIEKKEKIFISKPQPKFNKNNDQTLKKKLNNIESKIFKLEKEISNIDNDLLNNYENTISQLNFFPNYEKKKNELDSLMEKWEKITLSLY